MMREAWCRDCPSVFDLTVSAKAICPDCFSSNIHIDIDEDFTPICNLTDEEDD
jgi:Zn finger protein HypA/HybF involved in hydrogenase expression